MVDDVLDAKGYWLIYNFLGFFLRIYICQHNFYVSFLKIGTSNPRAHMILPWLLWRSPSTWKMSGIVNKMFLFISRTSFRVVRARILFLPPSLFPSLQVNPSLACKQCKKCTPDATLWSQANDMCASLLLLYYMPQNWVARRISKSGEEQRGKETQDFPIPSSYAEWAGFFSLFSQELCLETLFQNLKLPPVQVIPFPILVNG